MANPVTVTDFISHLRGKPAYQEQIVHIEHLPAAPPRYASLHRPLLKKMKEALHTAGLDRLYTHQAQAINAVREGNSVIVATSTASGKTLCYNLPVLEAIVADWRTRAIYLFPTKALAQDQLRSLHELISAGLGDIRYGTYDGDTPRNARAALRKSAAIILTNPDMLHVSILPNHGLWSRFFTNLRYVVIDEAHVYRGVFGSHVACILRRLRRVCEFYGARPQFICCSATIANPAEHAERLTGMPATVVDRDGSPQAPKEFVLWNPPFMDEAQTTRRSANSEATFLFTELVRHKLRNITFTRSRRVTELILRYSRESLEKDAPDLAARIAAYRGGYRPEERRDIEHRLFQGELLGVTATNALELGVDVGTLEATVQVGYPGSIASTWQQAGRAGRGKRHAISFLIGLDNPLDQYFMRNPEALFGRSHEHVLIDPGNPYVLSGHLLSAAYERPLISSDERLFEEGFETALILLERKGLLEYRNDRWYYSYRDYPAQGVNIRSISSNSLVIVNESEKCQTLEEIDEATAYFRVYPGAIYLHQGDSYLISRLDTNTLIAYARPTEVSYYTQPREISSIRIVRTQDTRQLRAGRVCFGEIRVSEQVIGYKRVEQYTGRVLGEESLDLPEQSFETQAIWFEVPRRMGLDIAAKGLDFHGGLHAVEHASIGVLPLFAMCDRMDIGGLSTPAHPDTGLPEVFIYDALPGGVGIARKGYAILENLWRATLQVIEECPCQEGCPSCIQSPKCGNYNEPLDKQAAIHILKALLGRGGK
ncbi:MAG: DEAD/DEAH box helicase [Anaerolineae bacterium]|nr:DEAD/DEAH box helicase [Anaerolineae bacterium]